MSSSTPDNEAAVGASGVGATYQSLREVITTEVRMAILSGRFRPGERLVEDRLAAEFSVSRNPVRESLRTLESEGLVVIKPRRGAFVAMLSNAEAGEIIELRAALEGLSARLAARRGDPAIKTRIAEVLERGMTAAQARNTDALVRINNEFHALLAQAGANRYLADFMRSLRDRTFWLFVPTSTVRTEESWREHAAILQAVEAGDEELAALLASRHVTNVGQFIAGAIDEAGMASGTDSADPIAAQ